MRMSTLFGLLLLLGLRLLLGLLLVMFAFQVPHALVLVEAE